MVVVGCGVTAVEPRPIPAGLPAASCPVCGYAGRWIPEQRAVLHLAVDKRRTLHVRSRCPMPPLDTAHPESTRGWHLRKAKP